MEDAEASQEILGKNKPQKEKKLKFKHGPTLLAVLSACLGSLCGGAVLGYPSPAIPSINSGENTFHLADDEVALAVSLASLGGFFGGIIGGMSVDKSGRKFTIMFNILPLVIGWLLIISSNEVYSLCVGRFLTGYTAGVMDSAVAIYVGEISAAQIRGFMGIFLQLFYTVGSLYVYSLGTFLSWRWLAVGCEVVPVFMISCMYFVPESPHYLLKTGQREECIRSLKWLRNKAEDIDFELDEMQETVKRMKQSSVGYSEFLKPNVYRPLGVILMLLLCQQMVGAGVVTQYMASILTSAGADLSANAQTAVVGAGGVMSCFLSSILIDKIGRRLVLFISSILITLSLISLSIYFTVLHVSPSFNINPLISTVCVALFTLAIQFGLNPVPFLLIGELLPLNVRGKAAGVTVSFVWVMIFITSLLFPFSVDFMGYHGTFWTMTTISIATTFYIYFFVPERKGMTLEQIEQTYAN